MVTNVLRWGLLLALLGGCTRADQGDQKRGLDACAKFEGGPERARWSGCPDGPRRDISCAKRVRRLSCDCLVDGAVKTFFFAVDPPLANRTDATRVARTECEFE